MSGCGGNCACAKAACEETKEKLGMGKETPSPSPETCPCGKPMAECCKVTGKTCGGGKCDNCTH